MIVGRRVSGITALSGLSPQLDLVRATKACRVARAHPHYPHLGMNWPVCWQACGQDQVSNLELWRLRLSRFFR